MPTAVPAALFSATLNSEGASDAKPGLAFGLVRMYSHGLSEMEA